MPLVGPVLFAHNAMSPWKGSGKVWAFLGLVLLISVISPWVMASSVTYSASADFSSTSGYKGWTYWDSLGQEMTYNNSNARWECVAGLPWCYWTRTGGHPGSDRNVLRRWTPPGAGSARITGTKQKDSNACNEQNVALGKTATQSSCNTGCWGGVPSRAVDGNTDGHWVNGSVMHTGSDPQAWLQIDLGTSYVIHRIEVWNRVDDGGGEAARATNFNVMTSTDLVNWTTVNVPGQCQYPTSLPWWSRGRYVKVQLVGTNYLNLAEVRVFSNAHDGVYTRIWHETAQSNFYLTYTSPGPTQRTTLPGGSTYMACSDANAYSFDTDAEIYPGDKIEFEIDRIGNNDADGTTFDPTIVFEPADAIGAPWTETSPTSITLRFNGVLKCPNGAACRYRPDAALPPDYYTVHRMGTITSGDFFVAKLDNWARCGPADGPLCLNPQRPSNFTVTDSAGIHPDSWYKYKIRAYKGTYPGGRLYGRTRMVEAVTGAIAPPALTPMASVTAASADFGARDAVISWQAPAPPLDRPASLERFELYRQALSSATEREWSALRGYGTGEQFCDLLPQAYFPGDWTCLKTSAPSGACNVSYSYGTADCARWDPPVRVGYTTWSNDLNYQIWVNTADQGSPSRKTDAGFGLITSVTDPGVDRKPTTYRYYLVARYKSAYASPTQRSEVTNKVVLPRADTVAGFADAHVHQFGNLAHGGTVLDGRAGDSNDGSPTYSGALRDMGGFMSNATGKAVRGCDPVADGGTGAHDYGPLGNLLVNLLGVSHDWAGIREMPKWLTYSSSLHQQVYKTALKRAVDGGLRLMVMQAVNSEFMCKAVASISGLGPVLNGIRGNGKSPISCDDSTVVDLQIEAAYRLQSEVDGEANCAVPDVGLPNTNLDNSCGWYRIVTTPAAARKAMKNGKLAVVLGMEVATPFGCGTGQGGGIWAGGNASSWNAGGTRSTCAVGTSGAGVVDILNPLDGNSLQHFYDRGVRHVFPVHGAQNGLGSTAFFNPSNLYAYNQAALNGAWFRPGACLNRGAALDGPMAYRISPTLSLSLGPFGRLDIGRSSPRAWPYRPAFPAAPARPATWAETLVTRRRRQASLRSDVRSCKR
ncbi:MAG: hypothetical protein DMF82_08580 [Acidobacteria bacterium]|nr:MAG: hypothetical protein DMF82_08580 [Acidobacteriota bacterium]